MRIWLVTIGEPVPADDGIADRLHRTGFLAKFLAARGHDVTWWTSTFDHMRKKHWADTDRTLERSEALQIRLLHGCGYRSNVSVRRFRDHAQIAAKYARLARVEARQPEVIVAALPTIELCAESVKHGRRQGIPVVLDMRDMWPDIFVDAVPRLARPAARCLLWPLFRKARKACAGATAIIGITEEFVDWGLRRGNRPRSPLDRAFPMGYLSSPPPPERILAAEKQWDERGVTAGASVMNAVFFGTIGRQFDLETVIGAARRLALQNQPIRFILCGTGDRVEYFKQLAAGLPNVMFPGWIDAAAIHVLMRRSAVGLDPLPDRYDFLATINNKAIEYLSAGLPVVSSPDKGTLARLLEKEQCGLSYAHGDSEGLTRILLHLAGDENVRQCMAGHAARIFQEEFTAEKIYGRMDEYLREIAAISARGKPMTSVAPYGSRSIDAVLV
jgi:glycosyltransferase involved in cell wall biosynthesis